jgi:hypothetical protein
MRKARLPTDRSLCNIPPMKLAWIAAALLASTLGCEKAPSKLDKIASNTPIGGPASGDLETRVARLEKKLAKVDAEALEFLAGAYEQVQEQQMKPQPGTIYGVDIQPNVQLGQVEGSPEALVTVVEAWDFA